MKLINLAHSPFAARVRIQAYAKGIELDYVAPEGLSTPQFKQFNILGKVPVLDTGEQLIPESIVIMDYLEDCFPEPPLRPHEPGKRAQMNIFYRFPDVYIQPVLLPLFRQLGADPRDESLIESETEALVGQLQLLDELLERFERYGHSNLDLADCALAPIIYYALAVPRMLGSGDVLADAPRLANWWQWVQEQAPVARVLAEIEEGMRAFMQKTD
ncbi:MAG: glutathione S-transferase family protein [Halieaceae bacterium]